MRGEEVVAHRFFAQEEVVDDEEEVLPRGHDHGGAGETLSTALTTRSPPSLSTQVLCRGAGEEQQQEMDRWSPAAPSRLSTRKQQRGRLPTGAYILIRAGTWARSKRGGFPHLVVAFRAIATHTLH